MICFARKIRGGTMQYVESTETGEIVFDAVTGTGTGFLAAAVGMSGIIGWTVTLVGFITVRRAFSRTCEAYVEERDSNAEADANPGVVLLNV